MREPFAKHFSEGAFTNQNQKTYFLKPCQFIPISRPRNATEGHNTSKEGYSRNFTNIATLK